MASSSEGSAALPTRSGDNTSGLAAAGPSSSQEMLVSKVLTYSDVSTDVARTGRIVLPRIQVQQCLPELLRLCKAEHALPAVRNGGPVKLSVDLVVMDEAGRTWVVLMKTWQNVVSGEHRPTFVLENTADFVRANRLTQGDTLAFCACQGHMLLRTSLRTDQLLPRTLKRGGGGNGSSAAAKRRAGAAAAKAAATDDAGAFAGPISGGSRKRKAAVLAASALDFLQMKAAAAWPGCPSTAEQAAAALLEMHTGTGASPDSDHSEQLAISAGGLHGHGSGGAARGCSPTSTAHPSVSPAHQRVIRPVPVHSGNAADLLSRVQQDRAATPTTACAPAPLAAAQHAQQQVLSSRQYSESLLPPAPPLSSVFTQGTKAGADMSAQSLSPEVLAQAHAWLAAIVAQQEQERRWVEQYNLMLLQQQLKEHHRYVAEVTSAARAAAVAALGGGAASMPPAQRPRLGEPAVPVPPAIQA